jgi:hypothetical protein
MEKFRLTAKDRSSEKAAQEQERTPPEQAHTPGPFDVGSHVGAVLSAAEEAAARIHEEARRDAERLRQQAQKEAAARSEAAREDADATRAEAERLRSEAEEWSKQARTAAEAFATDRRAEAEAEARRIVSAAERQATSFSEEAERRQQALKMDVSLAEDRLRQLSTGLHDLAARLDNLLTPAGETRDRVPTEQTIVDVLGPSRNAKEATM